MYLVSRFRHPRVVRNPRLRLRLVSNCGSAMGRYPGGAASTPDAGSERSRLQCTWEEAECSDVYLGGERFRIGGLLMHWMPIH
jgi:hypothetical protein